tara:strand:- start:3718 stop:4083 length:366 start_codon:yes stop_codon:yes gene_type:complete
MEKPFKMKGQPFKRNFGIGEKESPAKNWLANAGKAITANVKEAGGWGQVAAKSLAAGMRTLKGGYDAFQPTKEKQEELSTSQMLENFKQELDMDNLSQEEKDMIEDFENVIKKQNESEEEE